MALQVSNEIAAALAASQIINAINQVISQASSSIANGVPARGNQPAILASDLVAALSPAVVTKIQAGIAALS